MGTFWASQFDATEDPIEFVIDFGETKKLHSAELSWEFPAKTFSVSLSADGEHYAEAFGTDTNVLRATRVALNGRGARKLRIAMHEVCAFCILDSMIVVALRIVPASSSLFAVPRLQRMIVFVVSL